MNRFSRYTPIRIAFPFTAGVALFFLTGEIFSVFTLLTLACLFLAGLCIHYLFFRANFRWRWTAGVTTACCLAAFGNIVTCLHDPQHVAGSNNFGPRPDTSILLLRAGHTPEKKTRSYALKVKVVAMLTDTTAWERSGLKMLVYFTDSSCADIKYGDVIITRAVVQPISPPGNPNVFDFKKHMYNQGYTHQIFLKPHQWGKLNTSRSNPVRMYAEMCRARFLDVLRKYRVEGEQFALVTALMIGERAYLEPETVREFSYAGAIHVLSVSGLHVGIMYVLLDKLLFFLKRGKHGRKLQYILIIAGIWAYAVVTGLPSSVVRAALMFSIVAMANLFRRDSDNFNSVATAAFLQLFINPFELTQIGFQLSYLAVLGIFAFYRPFNNMVVTGNIAVAWIWSVIAVSLAAQLATGPLSVYYFNMFPVYFLITNLIVVPLASFITYFTVMLLFAGAAGLYPEWLAWPLKWCLDLMLGSVEWIQSWPGAVLRPVLPDAATTIFSYAAILFLFIMISTRKKKWLLPLMSAIAAVSVLFAVNQYNRIERCALYVYQHKGALAIDMMKNRRNLFVTDGRMQKDSTRLQILIEANRIKNRISLTDTLQISEKGQIGRQEYWYSRPFLNYMGKKIVFIHDEWLPGNAEQRVQCDLAILSGQSGFNDPAVLNRVKFERAILAPDLSYSREERIVKWLNDAGIPFHSVRKDGAFVMEWRSSEY